MVYIQVNVEHETMSLSKPFLYACDQPVQPGCRVLVPFGSQKLTGMTMEICEKPEHPGFKIRKVIEVIDKEPVLSAEQLDLARKLAHITISSPMSMVNCMLPSQLSSKSARPQVSQQTWLVKNPDASHLDDLSASQKRAWDQLPSAILLSKARHLLSDYMIRTLTQKRLIHKEKRVSEMGALEQAKQVEWPELNEEQKRALDQITTSENPISVLFGVTGSGKTEVYYHLAKEALEKGKQVLIMVPEIVLTPMMEQRFASRFTVDLFSYHSRLSPSQALSVWNSVKKAGPCIVIGTRKSVFLPFTDLGLIIMDEEHDSSYKQETMPRYHARDAALQRAQSFGARVVLGSATPSLDTFARALKNVYQLVEMKKRALNTHNRIRLVDTRYQPVYNNFSADLLKAMSKRLAAHEKSMLLLNRRGYLPVVRCLDCNEYLRCEDCNVPLSYHKKENSLVCHVCGRRYPLIEQCPQCGSSRLQSTGQGTERLEEDTQSLFEQAKIVRMDHDTTSTKDGHARRLAEFEQNGDILLGTQMIAKGLDFHDITLCGILSIDSLLTRPDYLASERAYQLAEQASGRAGRGDKPGEVLIQTYNPDHFVLQSVVHHDYRRFFAQEMAFRREAGNPPYSFLATVVIRHDDPVVAYNKALEIRESFAACQIDVLGPAEISMRSKQSRFRLILRDRSDGHLIDTLWLFAEWFGKHHDGSRSEINVHPMNLEE